MNSDIILGTFGSLIFLFIVVVFIFGGSPIVSSKHYNELKKQGRLLSCNNTIYKTGLGLVDPSYIDSKLGWHRTTRYITFSLMDNGLCLRQFNTRIGIMYNQVLSIDIREKNEAVNFPMTIIINFIINGTRHIVTLQTERNYLLIDALKRLYNGSINISD